MSEHTSQDRRFFKEWAKPGPLLDRVPEPAADETCDAISGDYRLYQYAKGHRFSTDDLLVAWFATTYAPRAERCLDLGSGIGSVGMMCAWRLPFAQFVTIEAQAESIKLARKSRAFNGLEDRYDIRESDFRADGILGPHEKFGLITGSPPYFPLTDGVLSDHPQKVACRFEVRGDVADYCRVAARHLDFGGMFFLVFPHNQEKRLLDGARECGLRILRSRAIIPREGEPPLLGLYQLTLDSHIPSKFAARLGEAGWAEPPLTIRLRDGTVHPEYSVVKLSLGFPP